MDHLVKLLIGTAWGTLVASSGEWSSVTAGIVVFAIGIVVGTVSVMVTEHVHQVRQARELERWIAAGKPERRQPSSGSHHHYQH